MVRVTKNGESVDCFGVWGSPKKRSFNAKRGYANSSWGYGNEPFVPTEKQFADPGWVRLRVNREEGWELA